MFFPCQVFDLLKLDYERIKMYRTWSSNITQIPGHPSSIASASIQILARHPSQESPLGLARAFVEAIVLAFDLHDLEMVAQIAYFDQKRLTPSFNMNFHLFRARWTCVWLMINFPCDLHLPFRIGTRQP
jgi:hypothetical protein